MSLKGFWFDRARADVDGGSWETLSAAATAPGLGDGVVAALGSGWQLPDPAPQPQKISWDGRRSQEIPAKQPVKKRRRFFGR